MVSRTLIVALVALAIAAPAVGMYEDEAGVADWHRENVGFVRHAAITGRRTLVASYSALAALNTKTGAILWRQVAPANEFFEQVSFGKKYVVTIAVQPPTQQSAEPAWRIAAWKASDGALMWDAVTETRPLALVVGSPQKAAKDDDDDADDDAGQAVVYLSRADESLEARSLKTGAVAWTKGGAAPRGCRLGVDGSAVVVAYFGRGGSVNLRVYTAEGAEHSSATMVETCDGRLGLAVVKDGAWCLSPDGSGVELVGATDSKQLVLQSPVSEILPLQPPGVPAIVARAGNALAVLKLDGSDAFRAAAPAGAFDAVAVTADDKDGALVVARLVVSESGSRLEVTDASGTLTSKSSHTVSLAENGRPVRLWAGAFRGRVYTVALLEDGSLHATGPAGALLWAREEALGEVEAAEFVDLPPRDVSHLRALRAEFAGSSSLLGAVVAIPRRLVVEARDAYVRAAALVRRFAAALAAAPGAAEGAEGGAATERPAAAPQPPPQALAKDRFGFDQAIVAATRPGVVYGLLTRGGGVWWRALVGRAARRQILHLTRAGASEDAGGPEVAVVRVFGQPAPSTEVLWLDAHSGRVAARESHSFAAVQSFVVAGAAAGGDGAVVLVARDAGGAVRLVATRGAQIGAVLRRAPGGRVSVFLVDGERLSGYVAAADAADPAGPLAVAWARGGEGSGERVVAVAAHPRREVAHSPGRILGNRTLLAKYLDANAFAYAAATPDGALAVTVADAVSGATIARVVHRKAGGPVRLALTEHSALYHYWAGAQYRLGAIDLYEPRLDWRATARSARTAPAAVALQATFVLPRAAAALAVTSSAHGAAAKQLVVALSGGAVYALEKRLVDPRRSAELSAEDRAEEGVAPYAPRLPLDPRAALSHNRSVAGVRFVETAPTLLESTSHVLAVGLDLFYARTAPSGAFDILNDDFGYELLIATVVGLLVVELALRWLIRRRALLNTFK